MNRKKALLGIGALVCAAAVLLAVYLVFRPQAQQGEKTITVEVIVGDETTATHTIVTEEEYLRGALDQENMVSGEEGPYGLFLTMVDGVTADDTKREWWCVTKGGAQVDTAVDATPIADGDRYELTLKTGW